MILIDTSVLVDAARGHTDAQAVIRTSMSADEPLTASVLTKVEMLRNVRSGERRRLRRLFDALEMQPVTDVVAEHAGALARQYRASHVGIDVVDYVIAATTLELGATLWTRNLKHFPMFPDLERPY